MATIEQSMTALNSVLGDIAAHKATAGLDRSLSCRFPDLGKVVLGRLRDGAVHDLEVVEDGPQVPRADVRLTMASDDLVAMTEGRLSFPRAFVAGRVKVEASLRDLLRLRSAF